ncbi:TonB dependent receptor [Myxococcus stipitatus DSM 14675]|uniref:TonB dependent receptor n=1 Tax=Myxococcus stipitatus (strain DSM 14675 / JCM 12634 / Mx s8) TaxID=1278073 RepID=L7UPW5_MYXSD|nr:TonB-dependent receptor [Myxococcus stipitatus]AGC48599.1 TonB dependent receptor [Myxococcus stipitatus DSM 14675]
MPRRSSALTSANRLLPWLLLPSLAWAQPGATETVRAPDASTAATTAATLHDAAASARHAPSESAPAESQAPVATSIPGEPNPPAAATTLDEPSIPARTVVTGTRTPRPVRDVPSTTVVLPREEIDRSPTLTQDSLVRTLPSVATFRRTPSLVADPTAQGLNVRGLAPSGVARTLVLLDGVPVNDPLGGWVFWRSLPRLGLERIEVVPGGGSALYGSSALGGVVQLISRPIAGPALDADVTYGNRGTGLLAARGAQRWGPVAAALETELLTSNGYPIVTPAQRGAIDSDTPSNHVVLNGRVDAQLSDALSLTARANLFRENQNGGTRFTTARVELAQLSANARLQTDTLGTFSLDLFGRALRFEQDRARVAQDRTTESLAASQAVPANDQGASLVWTAPTWSVGGVHHLSAGLDTRRLAGTSRERLFPPSQAPDTVIAREAGGTQWASGLFLQDLYAITPDLELSAALRLDVWRNTRGLQRVDRVSGASDATAFDDRTENQLSPRLGLRWRPWDALTLRASGYRAFRAPTLNELYRPFQVGTVLTAANADLRAERLWGAEAGVEVEPLRTLTARVTGFWNVLEDPITNVTLPGGAGRQRQNLGRARVRGVEASIDWRLSRRWTTLLAYTFVDPTVTAAPGQPDLVGRQLAQDPRHRGAVSLTFEDPSLVTATVQLRATGPQFEDDLNERRMGGALVVDAALSRRLFWKVDLFAAVENLFDREYLAGRAGVDTLGPPLLARVGLRLRDAL